MKFHAPENCPFCGAGLKGGGLGSARYTCGSHIWVREIRRPLRGDKSSRGSTIIYKLEYELKGHSGDGCIMRIEYNGF